MTLIQEKKKTKNVGSHALTFISHFILASAGVVLFFDCELANAVQGITTSLSSPFRKPFTQFEAYYVMSDMN